MKSLHLPNLFTWTDFNEERNIDFNSVLICLDGDNIVIDPLPLGEHDLSHLKQLGGIDWIVLTNSDHIRDAAELRQHFNAKVAGPAGEKEGFGYDCDRWLKHGDDMADVLKVIVMDGSKTSGELCLLYDDQTLITGDLIRAHKPQSLMVLPDAKLKDPQAALESIRRLTEYTQIETVLVGDGWHLFAEGHKELC
ncbi:MAG TPA: MBL fold metallo-hydrolase, partial [Candidatus Hydrogenedentes bacterium]|nr:MBL fold metallo-hydrolase [Candidatus Hydrogenedentota bacterium]